MRLPSIPGLRALDVPDLGVGPFRRHKPRTTTIDPRLAETIFDRSRETGDVISVRPFMDEFGIESLEQAVSFLVLIHRIERKWRGVTVNTTTPIANEIIYDNNQELLQFRFATPDERQRAHVQSELESHYQDAEIRELPPSFMPFAEGMTAAAAYLQLREDYRRPIKNFKDKPSWYRTRDPYASITAQMVNSMGSDAHVLVQFMMKPAISNASWQWRNWHSRPFEGPEKVADNIGGSDSFNWERLPKELGEGFSAMGRDVENSMMGRTRKRNKSGQQAEDRSWTKAGANDEDTPARDSITRIRGEKGFHVNIRIIAISEDPEEAVARVRNVAEAYESFYDSDFQQGFVPKYPSEAGVRKLVTQAAGREYVDRGLKFGQTNWACVGGRIIDTPVPEADCTLRRSDQGVPPRTPGYEEYDSQGVRYLDRDGGLPTLSRERYESDAHEWPYAFEPKPDPDPIHTRGNREILVERADYDTVPWDQEKKYMGAYGQAILENAMHGDVDDQPLFVGLDTNSRPVPITRDELRQHLLLTGYTGTGKSTALGLIYAWFFNTGGGGLVVDPGGEDTYKLLMALTDDALERVIPIDIGSDYSEYRVGINLLDTFLTPEDPGFEGEVDAKLSAILPLLETDDYKRMKGISEHIFRGLIESNFLDELPDTAAERAELEEQGVDIGLVEAVHDYFGEGHAAAGGGEANWTIADARNILASKENREAWYELVRDHDLDNLTSYARTLAEMDDSDDKLEPLLRRLKSWLESPLIRSFASLRQSTVSIPDAVMEEKIILLKADTASTELAKLTTGTLARFVWSAFLQMPLPKDLRRMELEGIDPPGSMTHDDYDLPDFLLGIDELAAVITDAMDLDRQLAEGRKRGLRVVAATQQYRQLTGDQRDAMANTGRQLAANPGNSREERNRVADIFPGISADEMASLEDYQMMTMGGKREPFLSEMFAPVPPRRAFDDAHAALREKEQKMGIKKGQEDQIGLPERFPNRISVGDADAGEEQAVDQTAAYRAFDDATIEHGRAVTVEEAKPRLRWYLGLNDAHDGVYQDLVDRLLTGHLEEEFVDGEPRYRLDEDQAGEFASAGTGSSGAKRVHRSACQQVRKELTPRGCRVEIVTQGEDSDADFLITPPGDRDPLLEQIAPNGGLVVGELEKSTGASQPCQTLRNLAGAMREGDSCLFAVPDGPDDLTAYARAVERTLTDPPFVKAEQRGGNRIDLYMTGNLTTAGGTRVWRPHTERDNAWWVDTMAGEVVIGDASGEEFARLPREALAGDGPDAALFEEADCLVAPKSEVDTDAYDSVARPFDPETEGIADLDPERWTILIVPVHADRDPMLFVDGECVGLEELPLDESVEESHEDGGDDDDGPLFEIDMG